MTKQVDIDFARPAHLHEILIWANSWRLDEDPLAREQAGRKGLRERWATAAT